MATGDDALAAGMAIMSGTEQANTLDTEINLTRDYVAQRTSAVTPVAKGGTGSTTATAARAALGVSAANTPTTIGGVPGASNVQADLDYLSAVKADSSALVAGLAGKASLADVNWVQDGNMSPSVYNRALPGSYRSLYVNSTGLLGWVSSSRAVKEDIEVAPIDVQAVLALEVVTYHRIAAPKGEIEHGLIAEDLDALGLTWLVDYGPEGDTPQGVRYDLLALALIPAVKDAHNRLDALEDRLTALENE